MLILPFLTDTDTPSIRKYDSLLQFLSGAASFFYPPSSSTTQELLFRPPSKDSASELLYSAAYKGVPDAQILLAQWAHGARAFSEALAWAAIVETHDENDFLEETNGTKASRLSLAFQQAIPSGNVSQARGRLQELKRKCEKIAGCRENFGAFLNEYTTIVAKRHSQAEAAFGLTWLGFQFVSAHLENAPTLTFAEVSRLDAQNAVASAFKSGAPLSFLKKMPDFDGLLNKLAPLMRHLGSIQSGIAWS